MTSWLGKSWWQGIGVLVAILLTISGWWWQQSRKELSYEVVSQTPLVSLEDPTSQQLQVLFNGKPVSDPNLIVLRVQNTGNVPIPTTDYEKPLTFRFGQAVEVLSAEITNMTPPNLSASVNISSNSVELSPVLLNSDDEILLKVLVASSDININAYARIIGVGEITEREADTRSVTDYIIIFINSISIIYAGLFFLGSAKNNGTKKWSVIISYIIASLFLILGILGSFSVISRIISRIT